MHDHARYINDQRSVMGDERRTLHQKRSVFDSDTRRLLPVDQVSWFSLHTNSRKSFYNKELRVRERREEKIEEVEVVVVSGGDICDENLTKVKIMWQYHC